MTRNHYALEQLVKADIDNEVLRLELHTARVNAGWTEFRASTVNCSDYKRLREHFPWVASRVIVRTERLAAGYPQDPPPSFWQEKGFNHRHENGVWFRESHGEYAVVAIENMAHLMASAQRLGFGLTVEPKDETGLHGLCVWDERAY